MGVADEQEGREGVSSPEKIKSQPSDTPLETNREYN